MDLTNVIWVYIILGLFAAASALYRLVLSLLGRGHWWLVHAVAMVALAGAWLFEHRTPAGWVCLVAAIIAEIAASVALGRQVKLQDEQRKNAERAAAALIEWRSSQRESPIDDETAENQAGGISQGVPSSNIAFRSLFTLAFLKSSYDMSPGVFLASLRRLGQRDASLGEPMDGNSTARFSVGAMYLDMQVSNIACNQDQIDAAVGQNWERPKTLASVAKHQAHVFFISWYDDSTPRDQIVRLHHRAHAALAEFAPVIGVLWPDAGKLYPLEKLENLAKQASIASDELSSTCTSCRAFALEAENAGMYLSDSLGLHAFGLPDIQIITRGHPSESDVSGLQNLINRFFQFGCEIHDGSPLEMGNGHLWKATKMRSTFTPDRDVIQLTVCETVDRDETK